MIWIGMGLALAAIATGCAGVEPTDVDDVESSDQIDHESSALVTAPADVLAAPNHVVNQLAGQGSAPPPEFDGASAPAPAQTPGGEVELKMDPEPSPWNQKRNSNNDT